VTPQRTSEGGAAGEPDGHPPIGDLDALTDCTAITIVNCPSKKPIAAIFISAHVLRESHSRRKARQANQPMQPCGVPPAELLQRFDGLPEADASTRTRLTPLPRQFLPKWPDGNTCAGIRSTYSRWIGGSQLQGIVEPNG